MSKAKLDNLYLTRAKEQINSLLTNYDFLYDAEKHEIVELIDKYNILSSVLPVLYSWKASDFLDEPNFDLIRSPIRVISTINKTIEPSVDSTYEYGTRDSAKHPAEVYITLEHDVTQPELKDFITKEYSTFIKPALEKSPLTKKKKKLVNVKTTMRDRIYMLHDMGFKPIQISKVTGYSLHKIKSDLDRRVKI